MSGCRYEEAYWVLYDKVARLLVDDREEFGGDVRSHQLLQKWDHLRSETDTKFNTLT